LKERKQSVDDEKNIYRNDSRVVTRTLAGIFSLLFLSSSFLILTTYWGSLLCFIFPILLGSRFLLKYQTFSSSLEQLLFLIASDNK
jgi:hypothetical protein